MDASLTEAMPEEEPSVTFNPGLALSGLGAAMVANSTVGGNAAQDLARLRADFEARKLQKYKQDRDEEARAGMAKYAASTPGFLPEGMTMEDYMALPMEVQTQMIIQHKSEEGKNTRQLVTEGGLNSRQEARLAQAGDHFDRNLSYKAGESAADRALRRERYLADVRLREATIDQASDHFDRNLSYKEGESEADRALRKEQYLADVRLREDSLAQSKAQFDLNFDRQTHESDRDYNFKRDQFAVQQEQWQTEHDYDRQKYDAADARSKDSGEAAKQLVIDSYNRLNDKEGAARIAEMPAEAFTDPTTMGSFNQIIDAAYTTPSAKSGKLAQWEQLVELQNAGDIEGAEQLLKIITPVGTVINTQEDIAKAAYKAGEKRLEGLNKTAEEAEIRNRDVNYVLQEYYKDPKLDSGPVASFLIKNKVFSAAAELGLIDKDSETFKRGVTLRDIDSLISKVFPTYREEGSGSTSDWEGVNLQQAFAQISDPREANILILERLASQNMRAQQKAILADQWLGENQSMHGFNAHWKDLVEKGDPLAGKPAIWSIDNIAPANIAKWVSSGDLIVGPKGDPDNGIPHVGSKVWTRRPGSSEYVPIVLTPENYQKILAEAEK
jgi:hypothetical protein